jgi:septum formation protein
MELWRAAEPLVLASKSNIRRALLTAAGVAVEIVPSVVDERAVESAAQAVSVSAVAVAALLARAKASAVALLRPGRLVLGADQVLSLDGRRFSKAADRATARAQLGALAGRSHELHSAIAFVQDATVLFEHASTTRLRMRALSDEFLESYLDAAGTAATESVGAYQLEGLGVQLFESVDGDYFTVLGLPLLAAMDFLRRRGCLLS